MIKHEILVVEETHQSNPRSSYTQWNPRQLQWKAEKETSQEKNLQVLMHSARQMVTTNVWKKKKLLVPLSSRRYFWMQSTHDVSHQNHIYLWKQTVVSTVSCGHPFKGNVYCIFLPFCWMQASTWMVQIYIDKSIYLMGEKRFLHHRLFIKI